MLIAKDLCLAFGNQVIFDHVSFTVEVGQKVGLVGRNGAGKSTMLKAIAQMQGLEDGVVSVERGKRIAYLPQEVVLNSTKTVLDEAFSAFAHIFDMKKELDELEAFFASHAAGTAEPAKVERYSYLLHECSDIDIAGLELKTKNILTGLGFSQERLYKSTDELSVGWKMRLVMAKLLLQDADLYLFDEPTNHLDIVAKDWFLEFLQASNAGFMLVSHDRYFLDHACDHILELERGKGTMYYGNYSKYIEQKEQAAELKERAYVQQQKEIKRKVETINRFKASANRATMAQSMMKALDKIERIEPDRKQGVARFSFTPVVRSGEIVLNVENISKSFDHNLLFKDVEFQVMREEKVALVAANGVGKSTLLTMIMGKMPHQGGVINFGHNVTPVCFEQDQEKSLDGQKTILQEVEDSCKTSHARSVARAFLGAFLFPGDDVHKRIAVLSGGEKNRVAMVKVLLAQANFFILDEPTNHLDLESKEILLQALKQFGGTILFVSHDRSFLDALATRVIELSPSGVKSYKGNYESYLYYKQQLAQSENSTAQGAPAKKAEQQKASGSESKNDGPVLSGKEAFELRKKRNSLERKIEKLESERDSQQKQYEDGKEEAATRLGEVTKQLQSAYAEWEKIQG